MFWFSLACLLPFQPGFHWHLPVADLVFEHLLNCLFTLPALPLCHDLGSQNIYKICQFSSSAYGLYCIILNLKSSQIKRWDIYKHTQECGSGAFIRDNSYSLGCCLFLLKDPQRQENMQTHLLLTRFSWSWIYIYEQLVDKQTDRQKERQTDGTCIRRGEWYSVRIDRLHIVS